MLRIRSIHVRYHLRLDPAKREAAERAYALHVDRCPVARTVRDCIAITTEIEMEPLE